MNDAPISILDAIAIINFLFLILIFPIIFRYKIQKKIEKDIGKKLEYHRRVYKYMGFTFYTYIEVAFYIFYKHLAYKMGYIPQKINLQDFSLQQINYDVTQAPKFYIVMSYLAMINGLGFIIFACVFSFLHPTEFTKALRQRVP